MSKLQRPRLKVLKMPGKELRGRELWAYLEDQVYRAEYQYGKNKPKDVARDIFEIRTFVHADKNRWFKGRLKFSSNLLREMLTSPQYQELAIGILLQAIASKPEEPLQSVFLQVFKEASCEVSEIEVIYKKLISEVNDAMRATNTEEDE